MTFHSLPNIPKSIAIKNNSPIKLPIHGQGIFLFSSSSSLKSTFYIYNSDHSDGLIVDFTKKSILVRRISDNKYLIDPENREGLIMQKGVYYWFSLDSQNTQFYAGYGEARKENKQYYYKLPPNTRPLLESLVTIEPDITISPMRLLRDPILQNVPLFVKDTNKLTMDEIAENSYMPDQ